MATNTGTINILSVEHLTKSFGERYLFKDITFGISKGQKVALVARNGSGKTTLLNILMGRESPDEGIITWRKGVSKIFLEQDPILPPDKTALETVLYSDDPVQQALYRYEKALLNQEEQPSDAHLEALQQAISDMDAHQAWDLESRVKEILAKLNITQLDQPVRSLSGGQKKRLALACALLAEPDFMVLDEPTNHLDYEMIEWLEEYLQRTNLSLLLVTHDRYFLDRLCDQIIELDENSLFTYNGNYEYYLEKREERAANQASEQDKARNLFRRELEWIRRQPKARTTKSKARIDSFADLEDKVKNKRLEEDLTLNVKMTRIGSKILDLKKVSKSYDGKTIIKGFSYVFKRGERIGIVGKNGVGKTTFLNMLMGVIEPDSGKIEIGETIVPGYFRQDGLEIKPHHRVIDVIKEIAEVIVLADGNKVSAQQFLQLFQFDYYKQQTPVEKLSGGERRRLHLATVLMKNPNLLILDEPTNDLDLLTLNILEDFLVHYPGCLIIVSHDRYFLDKLVDHLFIFAGNGEVYDYNGNYRQWRDEQLEKERIAREAKENSVPAPKKQDTPNYTAKGQLSFTERKEYNKLEKEIADHEKEIEKLENELATAGADFAKIEQISQKIGKLREAIDTKTDRWLELAERA
jgi:ATP-binding cassette subfamily F protein uup